MSSVSNNANSRESMQVENIPFVKGELQEPAFRDKWFGLLFLAHLITMVVVAIMYATGGLKSDFRRVLQEQDEDYRFSAQYGIRFLATFLLCLITSPLLSILAMLFMAKHPVKLIKFSLFFAIGFNLALTIVLAVAGSWGAITPGIFTVVMVCYAKVVWHRIPLAAANLRAAITCVQGNLGMVFLGLSNIPLFTLWFFLWGYVFQSVLFSPWMKTQEYEVEVTDDLYGKQHEEEKFSAAGVMAILGCLLSFYWTFQVLRNVVHTTLAGTVGTWWFTPDEASSCCSRGLTDSLYRSLTYSFGSICLGSLIVAIIETLKAWLQSMANDRGGLLRCIAQCFLGCIERIAEYFNKWAFIYVGLYGYTFVEAGKNVLSLFRHRGWTTLISDSLVSRVLGMMAFCIGLINALVAAILTLGTDSIVIGTSALFALLIGILMSSFVFDVLMSAVASIIVLFAEAPAEFNVNHPELAREVEEAWAQAWPDIFSPAAGMPTATTITNPTVSMSAVNNIIV
jgi:hypothetical protein